jgi:hypothetical protein
VSNLQSLEQQIIQSVRSLPVQQQEAVLEFSLSLHSHTSTAPLVTQSLQEIAKLPISERKKIIAPYLLATAEDFANDPAMTEFSVLDGEDWDS